MPNEKIPGVILPVYNPPVSKLRSFNGILGGTEKSVAVLATDSPDFSSIFSVWVPGNFYPKGSIVIIPAGSYATQPYYYSGIFGCIYANSSAIPYADILPPGATPVPGNQAVLWHLLCFLPFAFTRCNLPTVWVNGINPNAPT